jgi:hypothetical protein
MSIFNKANRTVVIKPTPQQLQESRKVQASADAIAHKRHLALNSGEDKYIQNLIDERAQKARELEANKPAQKVEQDLTIPKNMANKTFLQLGAENPREFFRLAPDPEVGVSTPEIQGFTVSTQKKINVANGQWYRVMTPPEYYLQYCVSPVDGVSKCLLVDTTSVKPCYLVVSANLSYNGGIDIQHLSPARFQDLIESRPPMSEILRVYRKTECSDVEYNLGAFDLSMAIPLWSTIE